MPASRGVDVAVAVKTFVERVEALESGASGLGEQAIAARALLAARGLTAERVAEAKATSAGLATWVVDTAPVSIVEREAAEKSMWSWYRQWSTIARVAIKERYILRALGFRKNQKADEAEGEGSDADGEANEDAAVPPSQPVLVLPARASSPEDMRRSTPA